MARNGNSPDLLADWTVMVFLAGDNNLSAECVFALTEMKRANLNGRVNVIAQFDPQDEHIPSRRFKLSNNPAPGKLLLDNLGRAPFQESARANTRAKKRAVALKEGGKAIIKAAGEGALGPSLKVELLGNGNGAGAGVAVAEGETDTGAPVTIYNFMSFCVERFKAKHYMVVLSGHGGGTETGFLMKDESPFGSLTIPELKQAFVDIQEDLDEGQKIDILGFDSCLMSMAEVCYELRGLVDIVVGSEGYSPASGWPYREILERLAREVDDAASVRETPETAASVRKRIAKGIVDEYVNFYADYWLGGVSVAQAALDVNKVKELKIHIDNLADALIGELDKPEARAALILAHWDAQAYYGEQFVDLTDFCNCLTERYESKEIRGLCETFTTFIASEFVLKSCHSGPAYQYSHGVSIYFPWSRVTPSYGELQFSQQSSWAKFLDAYTEKTRRLPRGIKPGPELDQLNSSLTSQRVRITVEQGPELPMFSMRNPPLIAAPGACIRARDSILKGMASLSESGELPQSVEQQASKQNPVKQQAKTPQTLKR
jgi:cysteine peptidase C11 family protein